MSAPKSMKVLVHNLDGAGHLNACIGFCQILSSRGHQVVALVNSAHQGQFKKFGIREIVLFRHSLPEKSATVDPVKVFAEMILKMGLMNGKSTLEKLKDESSQDFAVNLYESSVDFNPQIEKIIEQEKPDLFILDHFLVPPAVLKSKVPWVLLYSSNGLALYLSEKLPPYGSGYNTSSDPSTWTEFFEVHNKVLHDPFQQYQTKLFEHFNYKPTAHEATIQRNLFFLTSPYLNLFGCPKELAYDVPLPSNTFRVDAFCREDTNLEPFELPREFLAKPGTATIFLSLGSMGSIDIDLMQKITQIIAKTSHKCIVSKGLRADEYELPENCWGQAFLPQTQILPLVDLVITHGGNNTITETFSFGKPMIVLPLFSDQYDNAQIVHERGYGIRLEAYGFQEEELLEAIEKLLNDEELKHKLEKATKRIKEEKSKVKACEEIERLMENEWKNLRKD